MTGPIAGRRLWLLSIALLLPVLLIGAGANRAASPRLLPSAERRVLIDWRLGLTWLSSPTTSGEQVVAMADSVTSSEPNDDGLNPLNAEVTNQDHDVACARPCPPISQTETGTGSF